MYIKKIKFTTVSEIKYVDLFVCVVERSYCHNVELMVYSLVPHGKIVTVKFDGTGY
jgi:hypothetical protein